MKDDARTPSTIRRHADARAGLQWSGAMSTALLHSVPVSAGDSPLRVSRPGDRNEREADRMAQRALAGRAAPGLDAVGPSSRRSVPPLPPAMLPRSVTGALAQGRPLDAPLREDMEQRFQCDFSRVRLHTDAPAARSAKSLRAAAYTIGPHIVFGAGRFELQREGGQRLLAHELAHVAQRRRSNEAPMLQRQADEPAEEGGEPTSYSDRLVESAINQVAEEGAHLLVSSGPFPIPETIVAALAAAEAGFLHRSYQRLVERDEGLRLLGRVRELLSPSVAVEFYFRYLWGVAKGLVSPITGLVSLAAAGIQLQVAAVEWLATLPSRAPELVTEAQAIQRELESFSATASATLQSLTQRDQLFAFAGAILGAARQAPEAFEHTIVRAAQRKGRTAADSLIDTFLQAPLPELAETAGEIIGTVIIELVLLLFTDGIGNLITKAGEFVRALRPLSRGVVAFAEVAAGVGRVITQVEHIIGALLSRTVLRPLMPIFEALEPLLARMRGFAQRLVGLSERGAGELGAAGARISEDATRTGSRQQARRAATREAAAPVPAPTPTPAPEIAPSPAPTPEITARTPEIAPPAPPPSPEIAPPPPPRPPVRGATAEGVGEEFRVEYHPVPAEVPVQRGSLSGQPVASSTDEFVEAADRPHGAGDEFDDPDAVPDPEGRELLSGSRQAEEEVPANPEEVDQLTAGFGNDRFHASVSEEELVELAHELFPQYAHDPRLQGRVVLHEGRVRPGQGRPRGSTVPDLYLRGARRRPPISLEAKNYFVGEEQKYEEFIVDTVRQARQRAGALPRTAQQHLLIDLRGQEITREFAAGLARDLEARSGGILRIARIHFLPRSLQ
jgi:hypothetical protein